MGKRKDAGDGEVGKTAPDARPQASKPGFFSGTPAAPLAMKSAVLNPEHLFL